MERPISLHRVAERFKIPAAWVREQVALGKIPYLRVGRRLFFNEAAVASALAQMAAQYSTADAKKEAAGV